MEQDRAQLPWWRAAVACLMLIGSGIAAAQTPSRPVLSVVVDRAIATEGTQQPVRIELRLDRPAPAGGVCISLDVASGSATLNEDFRVVSGIPPIPQGGVMALVFINIIDDPRPEPDETVRIVLQQSDCYALGMQRDFSLLIRDDDDDAGTLQQRLQQIIANTPDGLIASQLANLGQLCATDQPPPGSELDRRCQLLRLALRDPNAARQLVDSLRGLVGEELSSQRRGFRMLAGNQLGAIGRRLEAVRGGGAGGVALVDSGVSGSHGFLPMAAVLAEDGELLGRGLGVFASVVVGDGERSATELESGYDNESNTYTVGIDRRFGTQWVAGVAYGRTQFDADFSADTGALSLDQDSLTFYASRAFERGWVDASFGTGRGQVRQVRIAQFQGVTDETSFSTRDVLLGSPDSSLITGSISGGWDWQRGGFSFGPRLAAEYARYEIDPFAEEAIEGSDAFAVALDQQSLRSVIGRLGLGAQWAISTRIGVLLPQFDGHFVTQFEDEAQALRGSFVNDPRRNQFLLPTSTVDSRYGEAAFSLAMQFTQGQSAFVSYRRLFGLDDTEQAYWNLGWRMEL
ncbi:MAG: autotransporter domain-containing protein [Pseudomarimonas sp.]